MDVRVVDESQLMYVETSSVDAMLAAEHSPTAEHIVVQAFQMPGSELSPVVMGGTAVSSASLNGTPTVDSELDMKLAPETLEHLRAGRAVLYRFEERGEMWLLQSSSNDPTVLQVQATLDTGQLQFQLQQPQQQQKTHQQQQIQQLQHFDASSTPVSPLQTIDVGDITTISMEMGGEKKLVDSESIELRGIVEVAGDTETSTALLAGGDASHSCVSLHQINADVHFGSAASADLAAAVLRNRDDQDGTQEPPASLEAGAGLLIGSEETPAISKVVVGAVPSNPVVTSVLQKKLTQADRTPLVTSIGRAPRGRPGGPVHQCGECGASFGSMFHLRRHQQTHTGARPFACPFCNLCFRHKTSLTVHIRRHTGEMPFGCTICGKRFRDPANFKVHVRSHTDEKNYECRLCSKKFNSASTLYAHNKTHENVKPYTCITCKKSFRFNTTLVRHIRTHTGEKPYACDRCDLCFATASNLSAHRRRHVNASAAGAPAAATAGSNSGSDDAIGSGSSSTSYADKPHSWGGGGALYQCDECGQDFYTKSGLRVHKKQQHEPPPEDDHLEATENDSLLAGGAAHLQTGWENATIVLQCPSCSEVYINEKELSDHMSSHSRQAHHLQQSQQQLPQTQLKGRLQAGNALKGHKDLRMRSVVMTKSTPVPSTSADAEPKSNATSTTAAATSDLSGKQHSWSPETSQAAVMAEKATVNRAAASSLQCETCGKCFESVEVHRAHLRTHNISKGIRVVYTVRSVC